MKTRLVNFYEKLRASFWFIPSLLAGLAFAASLSLVRLDEAMQAQDIARIPWIYRGGPEGARAVLSTIAGSMIGLTGITFSITIVALTLASTQFGPRLLKNFMRDRGNQFVLGTFIATFMYSLMVLRRVHGARESVFVPHLSVTMGVVLAMLSVGVLIYFIHHVAESIQAPHVIALVGGDLDEAIERIYPELIGDSFREDDPQPRPRDLPPRFRAEAFAIEASRGGYVQAIDGDGLIRLASEHDLILELLHRPGHHVIAGSTLALAWPGAKTDSEVAKAIQGMFIIGIERTGEQDAEFAALQLVEVAVRALSPGVNDPFTAINCVDRLSASLAKLARRKSPSGYRYDDEKQLRVLAKFDAFGDMARAFLDQIRQNGRGNAAVTVRLLEVIAEVASHVRRPEDRATLLRQAAMIERGSHQGLPEEEDRKDVQARYQEVLHALRAKAGPCAVPASGEELRPSDPPRALPRGNGLA